MKEIGKNAVIGVIGAGAMGSGIAHVAAAAGHPVLLFDASSESLNKGYDRIVKDLSALILKGKITEEAAKETREKISKVSSLNELSSCSLVIEAVIEDLKIKQDIFKQLEPIVSESCLLTSNTSSLSITSIASACSRPSRVAGIHFFNPATILPLVEIIPGIQTAPEVITICKMLIDSWKKTTVLAKDTPGFIVNRIARPFYGEAIRIYEEGQADFASIDAAMRDLGGFRMGPFELMDLIGNDVNFKVTETVWSQLFYDPRYRPSITQKRLYEAGYFGRKSGRGYYSYEENAIKPEAKSSNATAIFERVLSMLINEAADALLFNIASAEDIELAMTKGVNYPKGLLKWADEIGIAKVVDTLEKLQYRYGEDRYRCSPILKQYAAEKRTFF